MGYWVEQCDSDFFMSKENQDKALQAVKAAAYRDPKIFPACYDFTTFDLVLDVWDWMPSFDKDGNIIDIYFEGEKLGDMRTFLNAIAPLVKAGSFIEMEGEDRVLWRFQFNGETVSDKHPKIVWDD
jgi:hypothetical protein